MNPTSVSLSDLTHEKIDELVEISGKIIGIEANGFQLQEVNDEHSRGSIIECKYAQQVELSRSVSVKGRLKCKQILPNPEKSDLYFEVESLDYINDLVPQSEPSDEQTYFIEENLKSLEFKTADDFFQFLKVRAFQEGFRLTHKKSLKEKSITFRCDKHSLYGKSAQTTCNCQFKISITLSSQTGFYHVTTFYNQHSHLILPNMDPSFNLSADVKRLILAMFQSSIPLSKISLIIKNAHNIELTVPQLQILCRQWKSEDQQPESNETNHTLTPPKISELPRNETQPNLPISNNNSTLQNQDTQEAKTITPADILENPKIHIQTKIPTTDQVSIGPQRLTDLIYYIFSKQKIPKWLKIANASLIKSVTVLFLDGLTYPIFNQFKDLMPHLAWIEGNGFPLTVEAPAKAGQLVPGIHSFIGKVKTIKKQKIFSSYEEMICSLEDLYDCGFPLDVIPPHHPAKLRCMHFGINPLTTDEVKEYEKLPEPFEGAYDIIALDCEMIETEFGDECARLSVTSEDGSVILDQFFKPLGDIVDLRTEVSGITQDILATATSTSFESVAALSKFASRETIIVGHSLENDFRAMKLIHTKVIDSSILYNRECQYPYKPSLAKLYKKYIQKPFRAQINSHDSIDDARASFDLIKFSKIGAVHASKVKPQIPLLFHRLKPNLAKITYFAQFDELDYVDIDEQVNCVIQDDPDKRLQDSIKFIDEQKPPFVLVHFDELAKTPSIDDETTKSILAKYDSYFLAILEHVPPQGILIVYTGSGNPARLAADISTKDPKHQHPGKDPERIEEFEQCRKGIVWIYCHNK